MPVFPSKEWCEEAVRIANLDPESVRAGKGWHGDFGAIIEAEAGKLKAPFTVYVNPIEGKLTGLKVFKDPDDLEELDPVYQVSAPYSVWKGLLKGTLDPVEAVLKRQIKVQGNVQPLMERMQYRGIAERVLAAVPTTFADEA